MTCNLKRKFLRIAWGMFLLCMCERVRAEDRTILFQVVDKSEVEAVPGIVLLVNPGETRKSQAITTDARGTATSTVRCQFCTVSALDPQGRFVSRTTEFSGDKNPVKIVLELQPIIDKVSDPGSMKLKLVVEGPDGRRLISTILAIRPTLITTEENWVYMQSTDSSGSVAASLRPGRYVAAALANGEPLEARFQVSDRKASCSGAPTPCIPVGATQQTLGVRLSKTP